jgi:Uma2 family endonuclease
MPQTLAPPPRKRRPKVVHIGPADHGRRMSLDEFDKAIGQPGYLYELNKGVIEVSDVPHIRYGRQLQEVRDQLTGYKLANPGVIDYMGGGSDAKLLVEPAESERHPDLSVYLDPAPADADDIWSEWVPTIVVEVVSERSAKRDYEDKPAEYLAFGVDEYWIVDAERRQFTAMTRFRGQWRSKVFKPSQKYASRHLPGFSLDLKRVFAAGG